MHKRPGKQVKQVWQTAPAARSFLHLVSLSVLLSLGCSTPKNLPGGDPLLGGGPPRPRQPGQPGPAQGTAGAGQGTAGQPQASTNLPPLPGIPTSGTGFSPAALAAGRPGPFDQSRDLQINDWPRGPQGGGWTTPGPTTPRPNSSGVTLHPPEPLGETGSPPGPAAPPPAPAPSPLPANPAPPGPATTYEQALAQLQARGVLWQKPEMIGPGEWQFSCAVPHPRNPHQQRTYRAKGRDLLEAMQAVLREIDRDLRQ